MNMTKSTRHSKIAGDFAEGLVLYWLSKYGFECARVDHTGIDLIASGAKGDRRGISVKCRSRYDGTEGTSVNLPPDGFAKATQACERFGLEPYYAIVIDGADCIQCFIVSLAHLKTIATGRDAVMRYWPMDAASLKRHAKNSRIERFVLQTSACTWRNTVDKI